MGLSDETHPLPVRTRPHDVFSQNEGDYGLAPVQPQQIHMPITAAVVTNVCMFATSIINPFRIKTEEILDIIATKQIITAVL